MIINWELAYNVAAFSLGSAPSSTNFSEFVTIQRVALILTGPRSVVFNSWRSKEWGQ